MGVCRVGIQSGHHVRTHFLGKFTWTVAVPLSWSITQIPHPFIFQVQICPQKKGKPQDKPPLSLQESSFQPSRPSVACSSSDSPFVHHVPYRYLRPGDPAFARSRLMRRYISIPILPLAVFRLLYTFSVQSPVASTLEGARHLMESCYLFSGRSRFKISRQVASFAAIHIIHDVVTKGTVVENHEFQYTFSFQEFS